MSAAPVASIRPTSARGAWAHRALVAELARREFSGRYQGSFGGVAWAIAQPLFLLAVYTFAFGVVFKARWGDSGGTADYALMVFAGLIVFNAFAECLTRAPALVSANPNYVKKVVFPLEVLPWVLAIAATLHAAVGVIVWIGAYAAFAGTPSPSVLWFPVVLAAAFPLLLAIGWLLGSIGVLVRDLGQAMPIVSHALLFLSPIFYSIDMVPPALQAALQLNPLTFVVEQLRAVLHSGASPHWPGMVPYFAAACVIAWASLMAFRRLRPAFADFV